MKTNNWASNHMRDIIILLAAVSCAAGCTPGRPAVASPGAKGAACEHPLLPPGPRQTSQAARLELPAPQANNDKTTLVLIEEPGLKVVAIVLGPQGELPLHASAARVTITATRGAAVVTLGASEHRVDSGGVVVLPPGMPHAVRANSSEGVTLVVQHVAPQSAGLPLPTK